MHDAEKQLYDEEFMHLHRINAELGEVNQKLNKENSRWALYSVVITLLFLVTVFV